MSKISEMTAFEKSLVGSGPAKIREWYYGYNAYGVAWCACTQSYAANHCGLIGICFVKTDGAGCFAREGVPLGYGKWIAKGADKPKEGDLILYRYGSSYIDKYHSDHVGYVYAVDNNYVYTIEGNVNGSNDTSEVAYISHSLDDWRIHGYYRPNYPDGDDVEMNFEKGDRSDGVLAYKSLLIQARTLGLIKQQVDNTSGFGDGTYKATVEVQKKYGLEVDGIAGVNTITALRNAINKEIDKIKKTGLDRNTILDEAVNAINKLKV